MHNRPMALQLLAVLLLTLTLAACGETWSGMRTDTGRAMEATGETIEGAGEAVKPDDED